MRQRQRQRCVIATLLMPCYCYDIIMLIMLPPLADIHDCCCWNTSQKVTHHSITRLITTFPAHLLHPAKKCAGHATRCHRRQCHANKMIDSRIADIRRLRHYAMPLAS